MQHKKVLFITFDMSGYYTNVYNELKERYEHVDFYNTATMKYKYKNIFERLYSFIYKIFTGKKLKNYYKYNGLINSLKDKSYDITLIIRPDLFFDSQLEILKKGTKYFVSYYHDSISGIKRKKDVIPFFDKIYSYEKKDAMDYNLEFLPNFIYSSNETTNKTTKKSAFSVMSKDYRFPTLLKIAQFLKVNNIKYNFYVMEKPNKQNDLVTFISKRMSNEEVIENINNSKIIVDIHKYGMQEGLTFRVFEALGFRKKLITTNKDIKTYDFFNPNNIFVLEDIENINIPISFFEANYQDVSKEIIKKYSLKNWVTTIFST